MKIAIIGGGISGLLTAYLLREKAEVVVYEKNDWIGGHSHTVHINEEDEQIPVDTGFIVYNETNYPIFTKLLAQLDVKTIATQMSFCVHCERSGLQFNPRSFDTLFAQRGNLLSPSFWRMLWEAKSFRSNFAQLMEIDDEELTVKDYLKSQGYSDMFLEKLILPLAASIWSSPKETVEKFPLKMFVTFFKNHGFLGYRRQYHWRTVLGGSENYVKKLTAPLEGSIRLNSAVAKVVRREDCVEVIGAGGKCESYDQIVFACHSDEALQILADGATEAEREILSALPYQKNDVLLHCDTSILPQEEKLWASWNYFIPKEESAAVCISYDMNILQSLPRKREYLVTLNQRKQIAKEKVLGEYEYSHPQYMPGAMAAQSRHSEISSVNRTHYCGAYWRYGFHEDGAFSAVRVAKALGVDF